MDPEREFAEYVASLAKTLEHADRVEPLEDYCRGLMLSGDRKSVEPMAALVAPQRASAKHQSLHHFVAKAQWSDAAVLAEVRRQACGARATNPCRRVRTRATAFPANACVAIVLINRST